MPARRSRTTGRISSTRSSPASNPTPTPTPQTPPTRPRRRPRRWSSVPTASTTPRPEWRVDDDTAAATALPELGEDEIWVLVPGETVAVVTQLPKARHLPVAVAIRPGEIVARSGRRPRVEPYTWIGVLERTTKACPWPSKVVWSSSSATGLSGVKTKPRKYVIVTGVEDEPLGWLDYSDAWTLEGGQLKQMIQGGRAGLRGRALRDRDGVRAGPRFDWVQGCWADPWPRALRFPHPTCGPMAAPRCRSPSVRSTAMNPARP